MREVVMIVGFPASGKSTIVESYATSNYKILSRDVVGGNVEKLLPLMEGLLNEGRPVVLDCTFMTIEKRSPFIELAKKYNYSIKCVWMTAKTDDCQINQLMRMWNRYGRVFLHPSDFKEHEQAKKDPNMFPIAALFKMKKEFQKPDVSEGFDSVEKVKFVREYDPTFTQKALFLDYDGTLRDVVDGEYKFPTKPSEVSILSNTEQVLRKYIDDGYILFGVSNQSGIGRNQVSEENVIECFDYTNEQIGINIEVAYCPHGVPPVCYCRKPQGGLLVPFIMKHKIDIPNSIFVGDQTTDKTTATRFGMKFVHADDFFGRA